MKTNPVIDSLKLKRKTEAYDELLRVATQIYCANTIANHYTGKILDVSVQEAKQLIQKVKESCN